jgi:hypothetical protein
MKKGHYENVDASKYDLSPAGFVFNNNILYTPNIADERSRKAGVFVKKKN